MIPISYNFRNLVVRKTTTAAAASGLALVVFVLAAVVMLRESVATRIAVPKRVGIPRERIQCEGHPSR